MEDSERRAALATAITARLRPLCMDWPEDLFAAMVERLTEITMKYEGRSAAMYDRRSTETLVNELKAVLERSEAARGGEGGTSAPGLVSLLLPVTMELLNTFPTRIV
jgi:hypothetical protein